MGPGYGNIPIIFSSVLGCQHTIARWKERIKSNNRHMLDAPHPCLEDNLWATGKMVPVDNPWSRFHIHTFIQEKYYIMICWSVAAQPHLHLWTHGYFSRSVFYMSFQGCDANFFIFRPKKNYTMFCTSTTHGPGSIFIHLYRKNIISYFYFVTHIFI